MLNLKIHKAKFSRVQLTAPKSVHTSRNPLLKAKKLAFTPVSPQKTFFSSQTKTPTYPRNQLKFGLQLERQARLPEQISAKFHRNFHTSGPRRAELTPEVKKVIHATAPVLADHAYTISKTMYRNMFAAHPEVKALFNQGHQIETNSQPAKQPQALGNAITAYATHIEDLSPLIPAVELMAEKHISLNILPKHYGIVAHHLIGALQEVLGEAATPEIIEAWGKGYWFLANLLIKKEEEMMKANESLPGGWRGWRDFKVTKKLIENQIATVEFHPEDGKQVPLWKAGQYVGVRAQVPNQGWIQRNYSLSCPPNQDYFQLTINREVNHPQSPGVFSSYILNHLSEGDNLKFTVPTGGFYLREIQDSRPRVFLSGGVGATPQESMIGHLAEKQVDNTIYIIRCLRNEQRNFHHNNFSDLTSKNINFHYKVVYDEAPDHNHIGGSLTVKDIQKNIGQTKDAEFYVTGPGPWMRNIVKGLKDWGVKDQDIFYEYFGPLE